MPAPIQQSKSEVPAQAPLALVNLLCRGIPMAEARRQLGMVAEQPVEQPRSATQEPPAPAAADEALL